MHFFSKKILVGALSFIILLFAFFVLSNHAGAESANVNLQVYNPSMDPPPEKIPSYLRIISGNNQNSQTRNTEPLVVQILDQYNNPLPGVVISFSFVEVPGGAGGYSLSAGSKISGDNGLVSIDAILGDKAGSYIISASTGTLSVQFSLVYSPKETQPTSTPTPPIIPPPVDKLVPTYFEIVGGNNQTSSQQALSEQIVLRVLDQNRNPMPGIKVEIYFSAYPDGANGYLIFPLVGITDANGYVRFQITLGDKEGEYKITARAGDLTVTLSEKYQTTAASRLAEGLDNVAKTIGNIVNPVANSKIAELANKPLAYTAIIWAILSPLLANAPIALPWLTYIFNWLISFFQFGQKQKRWGLVYDSVSRKPVSGADVSLFNTSYNQLIETQTSDDKGRFVMNVKEGSYYLLVSAENYSYPSEYDLVGYRGKPFTVSESSKILVIDIPIDPIGKSTYKRRLSFAQLNQLADKLSYPMMTIGTLIAVAIALNRPDTTNFFILGLYEILWVFELIKLVKSRNYGIIYDAVTRKPIDYAIVRIFNAENRKLLNTKISNIQGHYSMLIGPGHYIVVAAKEGYQTVSKNLVIRKDNYLSENIFLNYPNTSGAST